MRPRGISASPVPMGMESEHPVATTHPPPESPPSEFQSDEGLGLRTLRRRADTGIMDRACLPTPPTFLLMHSNAQPFHRSVFLQEKKKKEIKRM